MTLLSRRYTAQLASCALVILTGACGSSSSSPAPVTTGENDGATVSDATPVGSATGCPNSVIGILFNPMYSAYDGTHTFQIPAVVNGIDPSAIVWSASDPTMVAFQPDPITKGTLITIQKSGTVSIIAQAGTICGSSLLTITAATPDQWDTGSQRYNNGTVVTAGRGGQVQLTDASSDAKCTNCHGDTANGPYKTVAHTPEQTGGFSDDELRNIFQHGNVPDGGYFDTSIVMYSTWHAFHQWGLTDDEATGIIVYLRSLTPEAQAGQANFGGRFDGGFPGREGGGGMRPEGGGGRGGGDAAPQPEAAPVDTSDATSTAADVSVTEPADASTE